MICGQLDLPLYEYVRPDLFVIMYVFEVPYIFLLVCKLPHDLMGCYNVAHILTYYACKFSVYKHKSMQKIGGKFFLEPDVPPDQFLFLFLLMKSWVSRDTAFHPRSGRAPLFGAAVVGKKRLAG